MTKHNYHLSQLGLEKRKESARIRKEIKMRDFPDEVKERKENFSKKLYLDKIREEGSDSHLTLEEFRKKIRNKKVLILKFTTRHDIEEEMKIKITTILYETKMSEIDKFSPCSAYDNLKEEEFEKVELIHL